MRSRSAVMVIAMIAAIQLFASTPTASAQSKVDKPPNGSISGVVTRDGRPEPGVGVLLMQAWSNPSQATAIARAKTDKEGRFVFEGIARGSYSIDAFAPGLVVFDESPWDGAVSVSVGEGESVTNVSIALNKGGAITGRLVDEEGNSVVSQPIRVFVKGPDGKYRQLSAFKTSVDSDDRGIYRVFGLPPGTYAVAAGLSDVERGLNRLSGAAFEQRFHGGSTKLEDAKPVELTAGGEARDVDIAMARRTNQNFVIRGRVINSDTKKPMAGVNVYCGPRRNGQFASILKVEPASSTGEFSLTGIPVGTYGIAASLGASEQGSFSCDPVEVPVVDADIGNVVIEMTPAATVSGVVAPVETDPGLDLSAIEDRVISLVAVADPASSERGPRRWSMAGIRVRPDRTFTITGVRPGHYRMVIPRLGRVTGLYVQRTEVDGAPLAGPIRIDGVESIANVRIVIGRATGAIRGKVVGRNGTIDFSRVNVMVGAPDAGLPLAAERVDSSGSFLFEGVVPGEAVVLADCYVEGGKPAITKSIRVTVPQDGTVEVTIEIDVEAAPKTGGGGQ